MTSRHYMLLLLIAVIGLAGCAGARPVVRFDTAKYPVSMSNKIIDRNGRIIGPEKQIAVGRFETEKIGYAMGYSHLALNSVDFSDELNRQVEGVKGEAVVNLEVASKNLSCMCMNMSCITQALPIFPGCAKVSVSGDIIRARAHRIASP